MLQRIGPLRTAGLALGMVAVATAFSVPEDPASDTSRLTYKAYPKWDFILPDERWDLAEDFVGIAHASNSAGFAAEKTGVMALEIDTNGDGKLDEKIKGDFGYAKLRGKTEDGERFLYAIRVVYDGTYRWSTGGAVTGKLHGITFKVIDQNNNGSYADYGEDAMIVGAGESACFLSKVVNLDGELYDLEVAPDGSRASVTPYQGASGILNLQESYETRGTLLAAVVRSGELSFNLAGHDNGLRVPTGRYDLASGFVARAGESVRVRRGKSAPMVVEADTEFSLEWGGPVVAEFDYRVSGEAITVSENVAFFGNGGEEYFKFQPDAKSPKILVYDAETGELLDSGRFGGC